MCVVCMACVWGVRGGVKRVCREAWGPRGGGSTGGMGENECPGEIFASVVVCDAMSVLCQRAARH